MRRIAALAFLWIALSGAACGPAAHENARNAPVAADTIWYVSSRARSHGQVTLQLADSLEYGLVLAIPRVRGDTLTDAIAFQFVDSVRLSRATFTALLRAHESAGPRDAPVVVSVHGYGTSQREAWTRAAVARMRAGTRVPWIVYSWPSHGSGFAWPQHGEVFTRAYREDSSAAAASRPGFVEALCTVLDAVGAANTIVLAHSLGAQIVAESFLEDHALNTRLRADPLRALVFLAPDVERGRFSNYYRPAVLPLARRVVLYASRNDRVLAMSRLVNEGERAGLFSDRDAASVVHPGVETVDVTDGITADGFWRRVFGTHHSLGPASGTYYDLINIVGAGYGPSCRSTIGTGVRDASGMWELTGVRGPRLAARASCSREH